MKEASGYKAEEQQRKIKHEILVKLAENSLSLDWVNIAIVAKDLYPELHYSELCDTFRNQGSSRCGEIPYTPASVRDLFKIWIKEFESKHIFLPVADGSECIGTDNDENIEYRIQNVEYKTAARAFMKLKVTDEIDLDSCYDLIISDLPFSYFGSKSPSCEIVERCIDVLSDEGYALYTFPISVTTGVGNKWIKSLEDKGLFCNAILDLPFNSYAPMTLVDSVVVVFSKQKSNKNFIGLLNDKNSIDQIVKNFKGKESSKVNAKLGVFVDEDVRCYSDYLNSQRLEKAYKNIEKSYNASLKSITEIGSVKLPDKDYKFEQNASSIYIPKLGNSDVVTCEDDFKIKAQNYFQVVTDDQLIIPRFLSFFFNSEEGLKIRQMNYKGGTIKALSKRIVEQMKIPCPPMDVQRDYLQVIDELEILKIEIESLRAKMQKIPASYKNIKKEMRDINNHGDKFEQWIESLPYPLATILKRYSVTDESSKKQEMLFYFFEAYAIFEATILSATIDKRGMDCSSLKNVEASFFEKASFGSWVHLDRVISNLHLKQINSSNEEEKRISLNCFRTGDENLVKYISNKTVCNILQEASEKRNVWKGHGGITSEDIYTDHVSALDSLMRKLQENVKDLYERIRLIRPLALDYKSGKFKNKVEILTGSNAIFNKDEIESLYPLDSTKLYLQVMDTNEMIELPPFFILKNSPAEAKNACYFYFRIEDGNTKYVSYHYDDRPEDMESGELVLDSLKNILSVE